MEEQIKIAKTELSNEEIAYLSDAQLKTLIKMLTEMVEYSCKIEEEVKAMQSEIKKNRQETDREPTATGRKLVLKSTEGRNKHLTRTE